MVRKIIVFINLKNTEKDKMHIRLFNSSRNKRPSREQRILHKEILRKEQQIHELKEQNKLLLKTTVRQSRTITELKEKLKQVNEQIGSLTNKNKPELQQEHKLKF